MHAFDVVIVGSGVIGTSIAFELAAEKLRIALVDRQQPGREASWAAAGMLSPSPHNPQDVPLVPLAQQSLKLYPQFVQAIEDESGKSIAYDRLGVLEIFTEADGESNRDKMIAGRRALGLYLERLPIAEARKFERGLGPSVTAAAALREEGVVDPRLLMEALTLATQRRGVEMITDCRVTGLLCDGSRCRGVMTETGQISASHVVVAAGCFSSDIAIQNSRSTGQPLELSHYAPTRPVRGQMLALRPKDKSLRHILRSHEGYLVPRRDGRIVAGSTLEEAGFEKAVTTGGLSQIINAGRKLWSEIEQAAILETWCGLRPGTPDDLPILGPTDIEGLLIATGHYRNGILLAPASAKLVGEWVTRGKTSFDAEAFSPLRFALRRLQKQTAD